VPEKIYSAALDALYQAISEPTAWDAFLDEFSRLVGASCGRYVVWDKRSNTTVFSALSQTDPIDAGRAYIEHYGSFDSELRLYTEQVQRRWILRQQKSGERNFSPRGDSQDILTSCGYVAGLALGEHSELNAVITMHRGVDRPPFGVHEMAWLERIQPHLERASRLHVEVSQLRLRAAVTEDAFSALAYPVLLIDEYGRVWFANLAAERWTGEEGHVSASCGTLQSRHAKLDETLRSLILGATRGHQGARTSGVMSVPHKCNGHSLATKPDSILVVPLRPEAKLSMPWHRPLAMLIVVDATAPSPLAPETLEALFALPPAEARRIIEAWRIEYNTERPHSSLGDLPPEESATKSLLAGKTELSLTAASTNRPY